jgi:hypothetical protein
MRNLRVIELSMALMAAVLAAPAGASEEAEALIAQVAEAMGGADAVLAIDTLQADGYGMEAYFWGGGNVTGDPEAPQKWAENPNFSSVWDFAGERYRTQYRHNFLFPFGGIFGHSFGLSAWGIDGDVGYTIAPGGNATRLADWTTGGAWFKPDGMIFRAYEALGHPVAAVRAVLSGGAMAENLRIENGVSAIDLLIDEGYVTLGIDPATLLPRWIRWTVPHQNLGQVVMTTTFVGYQDWDGVQLPFTWSTRIDWRNTLVQTRILDAYYVNSANTPDIAAPANVVSRATGTTDHRHRSCRRHLALQPGRPHGGRIRRPSRDVRTRRQHRAGARCNRAGQRARARQEADAPDRVASPFRPHARLSRGDRSRANGHLAPW